MSQTFRSFQSALGLSITARCPISCAHCIVGAGRHRREEMSPDTARSCLDACVAGERRNTRAIIVTGGEPFYTPALLHSVLDHASSLGLVPTVVTNAFWASTPAAARATLKRFPAIGMLTISTDVYHRAFISITKVKYAALAARELSIPFTAAVCADTHAERLRIARELDGIVEPDRIRIVGTLPAGRGADRLPGATTVDIGDLDEPCAGAEFPIVFPDGRVIACMGIVDGLSAPHPLLLGDVGRVPLDVLLASAETNVFLHAMRSVGPGAIARALDRGVPAGPPVPVGAHGGCSLCYAMAGDPRLLDRVLSLLSTTTARERVADARLRRLGEEWPADGGLRARCDEGGRAS